MQTLKIEAYSLFEFCQKVQEGITQGFVFDFDSNENFPTAFGSLLVAGMVPVKKTTEVPKGVELDVIEMETTDAPVVASRGRPKNK